MTKYSEMLVARYRVSANVDEVISEYYHATHSVEPLVRSRITRYLSQLINANDPTFTQEHYRNLVLPSLGLYLFGYTKPIAFVVVMNALKNPNCPVDVLIAACHCITEEYRSVAVQNPNCPEDNRICAALLGISRPKVSA